MLVLLLEGHDLVQRLRLEIHRDIRLRELGLDELCGLKDPGVTGRDEELELQWSFADIGNELLGTIGVSLRPRLEARVVGEVCG